MTKKLALVMVMVFALTFAAPVLADDTVEKIKDTTDKISSVLKDIGTIFDSGKTIVDEINKVGNVTDPQMNPQYLALKQREIQRAYEDFKDAKDRCEDAWFFQKSGRKKEMDRAREEYLDKVERLAKAQVDFKYDIYVNTDGYMSWRKPARKQNYQEALKEYTEYLVQRADNNYKRKRQEYEDEWWIFFWSKMKKKKAMEEAKENRGQTFDRVEDIWREAGLFSDSGWFDIKEALPASEPAQEVDRIEVDKEDDM